MRLDDILVCVDSTRASGERVGVAVRLAAASKAHLTGIYALLDDAVETVLFPRDRLAAAVAGGPLLGQTGTEPPPEPVAPGVARAEAAELQFRETLQTHAVKGDWHLIDGTGTDELIELAKTADLVVLGQIEPDAPGRNLSRPEEVAVACGRPVLIVPYAGSFATLGTRPLIAWDGTREAARALHDALPLMEGAETATIVTAIASESAREGAAAALARVVRHLERHGIPARPEPSLRGDLPVSDLLLSRAADLGADLIVAGAYHHSPYREAVFGGVTHDLLDHMTVPVLMAH